MAWSWVGGRLAPFYIHQMNRVNSRNGSAMMTAPHHKHCLGIIIIIIIISIIISVTVRDRDMVTIHMTYDMTYQVVVVHAVLIGTIVGVLE